MNWRKYVTYPKTTFIEFQGIEIGNKKADGNSPPAFGIKNSFYFESISLKPFPAENVGTVLAAIFKVAPV